MGGGGADKTVGDGVCTESHGAVGRLSLRFMGQSVGGGSKWARIMEIQNLCLFC